MGVANCNCNITDEELINDINSSMLSSSQIDSISTLFKVLGDPTRAKIVLALDNREVCVCTLANALGMTKSAVSHQLAILKANNIVKSRRVLIPIMSPLLFLNPISMFSINLLLLKNILSIIMILSFSYRSSTLISSNISVSPYYIL